MRVAVYALTARGLALGQKIAAGLGERGEAALFGPERLVAQSPPGLIPFKRLKEALKEGFATYEGLVAIGAIGLYFRLLAPLLKDKRQDPAVVGLGEDGRYAVSLLSGHLGGANGLAQRVAAIVGGEAVVTTATDLNGQPAIEVLARENGLVVENWPSLAPLARLLAEGEKAPLDDPHGFLAAALTPWPESFRPCGPEPEEAGLWVDYLAPAPANRLVLRPKVFAVGVGAHRGIGFEELRDFLGATFLEFGLALKSIRVLATIDRRVGEEGLALLAKSLSVPLIGYDPAALGAVAAPNPSELVRKNVGVNSVCEAAALLAAQPGRLLVPKRKSARATLAVALIDWKSSAWAQAMRAG
jgi:cobalt-precorrin 5A hydrolase